MSYNHILVAVDLNSDNQKVVDKAIHLAKALSAKVSLIHINKQVTDDSVFGGLIDIDLAMMVPAYPTVSDLGQKLETLADDLDYPIAHKFVVKGDMSHGFEGPIKEVDIDLIICGHHHNFWSRLKPSTRDLLNTSPVDLLIIPLED